MGGRSISWLDERVQTINDELGAAEADERMARGDERQRSEGVPEHVDGYDGTRHLRSYSGRQPGLYQLAYIATT